MTLWPDAGAQIRHVRTPRSWTAGEVVLSRAATRCTAGLIRVRSGRPAAQSGVDPNDDPDGGQPQIAVVELPDCDQS